ncbi:MAG: site-2 protease family protein, partial [Candidatus Diapherotrites archaeon]|nr:site-2 protease family protein [Candidatus Diapherotrites archaeon]
MRNFSLGKLFGIRLELHSTFILLIAAITGFLAIFDFPSLVPTLVLLFFLFVSVFIHELFHSIVAISKGIK